MYTIGELSQQTGVSRETIRYYERISVLPLPLRNTSGYRQYSMRDIERLLFIRKARSLDFSLDEIREILALRDQHEPPCQYVMTVMEQHVNEIEERISDLIKLRDKISQLHTLGLQLPDDIEMKTCICRLISTDDSKHSFKHIAK